MTINRKELDAAVRAVAERLEQDAPAVSMTEDRLVKVAEECAEDQVLNAGVMSALPVIASGETQGAYARRVREGLSE